MTKTQKPKKAFPCPMCDYSSDHAWGLTVHHGRMHKPKGYVSNKNKNTNSSLKDETRQNIMDGVRKLLFGKPKGLLISDIIRHLNENGFNVSYDVVKKVMSAAQLSDHGIVKLDKDSYALRPNPVEGETVNGGVIDNFSHDVWRLRVETLEIQKQGLINATKALIDCMR